MWATCSAPWWPGLGLGLVQAIGIGIFGGGYASLVVYVVFFIALTLR